MIEGRDPDRDGRQENGFFEIFVDGLSAGARYMFALPSGQRVPDPASRFQPDDVDGPSEAIDPGAYRWRERWTGREWDDVVLYELHVGAFSPEGTFAGAARKLDHLADLGVTAVEIMPVSDFKGRWNWGYDGAFPYAPDASYGRPEDFKAFVEAAHERGIAVLLDVVYNHFGPEGNFLSLYAPDFFTSRHKTPWGDAIQFRRTRTRAPCATSSSRTPNIGSRSFISTGCASTPSMRSRTIRGPTSSTNSPRGFARDSRGPSISSSRTRTMFRAPDAPRRTRPILYTAQWNDDIHHVLHVAATREKQRLLRRLWRDGASGQSARRRLRLSRPDVALSGRAARRPERRAAAGRLRLLHPEPRPDRQPRVRRAAERAGAPRGHPGACERLSARAADPDAVHGRGMGREQPFLFFCDFEGELAEAVRKGRREEFSRFPEFADPERVAKIPDPCAEVDLPGLQARLEPDRRGRISPAIASSCSSAATSCSRCCRPSSAAARRSSWASRLCASSGGPASGGCPGRQSLVRRRSPFPRATAVRSGVAARPALSFGPWSVRWSVDRHDPSSRDLPSAAARPASASATRRRSRPISRASASAMSICRRSSRRGRAARTATTSPIITSSIRSSGRKSDFAAMIDAFRATASGASSTSSRTTWASGGADNPLWLDVLEWGPDSQYAGWFDIDWRRRSGKLLAPVLGAQYGEELRSGKLALRFEDDGTFAVWAYDAHKLPIRPLTFPIILGHEHAALDRMADRFLDLPHWRPQMAERARALKSELAALASER